MPKKNQKIKSSQLTVSSAEVICGGDLSVTDSATSSGLAFIYQISRMKCREHRIDRDGEIAKSLLNPKAKLMGYLINLIFYQYFNAFLHLWAWKFARDLTSGYQY